MSDLKSVGSNRSQIKICRLASFITFLLGTIWVLYLAYRQILWIWPPAALTAEESGGSGIAAVFVYFGIPLISLILASQSTAKKWTRAFSRLWGLLLILQSLYSIYSLCKYLFIYYDWALILSLTKGTNLHLIAILFRVLILTLGISLVYCLSENNITNSSLTKNGEATSKL